MALIKQTPTSTLISISALLFSTLFVNALSSMSPAPSPAPAVAIPADDDSLKLNPADIALPNVGEPTEISLDKETAVAKVVSTQMQAVEKKIDDFGAVLKKRLEDPNASASTHECIEQCFELFGAAVDDIKSTLDCLKSRNLFKANYDVSAISTNVDTCNECFKEMVGEDPELKKFDDWVNAVTGEALASIQAVAS